MTIERLLEWVEDKIEDFDTYDDIENLNKDVLSAPSKYGGKPDGRTKAAEEVLERWTKNEFDGQLGNVAYDKVIEKVSENKLNSISKMSPEEAKEEYNRIINKGYPNIDEIKEIVDREEDYLIELEELEELINSVDNAKTISKIQDAISNTPGVGSTRKKYGDKIADKLSLAIANAAEREYDLKHPNQ